MEIDVIVEGLDWVGREQFPYDEFREVLAGIGVHVGGIRFVR